MEKSPQKTEICIDWKVANTNAIPLLFYRARRNLLMAQLQYHEFLRECSDLRKWIGEKTVAASSQDLGQDFEHLEILVNKYESLRKEIAGGKDKLENCVTLSQRLQNPEPEVAALVANNRCLLIAQKSITYIVWVSLHALFIDFT